MLRFFAPNGPVKILSVLLLSFFSLCVVLPRKKRVQFLGDSFALVHWLNGRYTRDFPKYWRQFPGMCANGSVSKTKWEKIFSWKCHTFADTLLLYLDIYVLFVSLRFSFAHCNFHSAGLLSHVTMIYECAECISVGIHASIYGTQFAGY